MDASNKTYRALTAPWPDEPPVLAHARNVAPGKSVALIKQIGGSFVAHSLTDRQEFDTYAEAKAWLEAMLLVGL